MEEVENEDKEREGELDGADKAKASIAEMQRHAEGLISALGGVAIAPAQAAPAGASEGSSGSSGVGGVDLSAPVGTNMEQLD